MSFELAIPGSFPLKDNDRFIDVTVSVAKQWGVYVHRSHGTVPFDIPATIEFDFHCPNACEYPHVVSADGHRCVVNALVAAGVLPGAGWKYISGFVDKFQIDAKDPRVVVRIV